MNLNTKYTRKKKLKPMRQVLIASPNEDSRTAYVPVMNAMIIVPMPIMVKHVATPNNISVVPTSSISSSFTFSKPLISEIKKWIKTAKIESTNDIVSDMTNTIKAAFLARIAVPRSLL